MIEQVGRALGRGGGSSPLVLTLGATTLDRGRWLALSGYRIERLASPLATLRGKASSFVFSVCF